MTKDLENREGEGGNDERLGSPSTRRVGAIRRLERYTTATHHAPPRRRRRTGRHLRFAVFARARRSRHGGAAVGRRATGALMCDVCGRSCLFLALYALPCRNASSVVPSTVFVA